MHWIGWFTTVVLLLAVAVALNPVKLPIGRLPLWCAAIAFVVLLVLEIMRRKRRNIRDWTSL